MVEESAGADSLDTMSTEELSINTIRTLAMDAVQRANSGHPGTPMALAPLAYALWTRVMRYNPRNPGWINRDRFVLSAGHASMLQYAMLYLTGYDLTLDEIKDFRQWGSPTPGHPEYGHTAGIETTTGPLGQGLMNSVGLAIAEAHLAAVFNRPDNEIIDHHTYVIGSDGDLMEGASHEAASLAGHLGLGKLIWIYDDNHITIDGDTDLAFSDDAGTRFEAYGWHVQNVGEQARDIEVLTGALDTARAETDRPSLIIVRSHIGYGAPNKQDTADAHGAPLGDEEIRLTKKNYGWPEDLHFHVPERALEHMRQAVDRGAAAEAAWSDRWTAYEAAHPELAAALEEWLAGVPPAGWDDGIPNFEPGDGPIATRAASGKVLNGFADRVPWLMGGSADLTGSTKTLISSSGAFSRHDYGQRNMFWGVREHAMCAVSTGMALHGGVRPYAATFFVFTDYARPAIRLAAMMGQPVIYVMTHDSIGLGEDGPTHQPIEHLASLRAMPGLTIVRPADANETAYAWRAAIERLDGPTMMVLTRQKLPVLDRTPLGNATGTLRGAYVLSRESGTTADLILIATGSEVPLALEAQGLLGAAGINTRVVSMPSWELFRNQDQEYRDHVLPPAVGARLAVEAGATQGWLEWVGPRGDVIGLDRFGASAPAAENFSHFGFTAANVVERARALVQAG